MFENAKATPVTNPLDPPMRPFFIFSFCMMHRYFIVLGNSLDATSFSQAITRMSYCKFCIHSLPVNSKFLI